MALNRSLAIAEERGDAVDQLRLLGPLHMFHLRIGDLKVALQYAKRSSAVAGNLENPVASALAHSLLGISLHLMGDHGGARAEVEAALEDGPGPHQASTVYLGFDHYNWRVSPSQRPCGCKAIRPRR